MFTFIGLGIYLLITVIRFILHKIKFDKELLNILSEIAESQKNKK